jgi:hypothetical protein
MTETISIMMPNKMRKKKYKQSKTKCEGNTTRSWKQCNDESRIYKIDSTNWDSKGGRESNYYNSNLVMSEESTT